MKTNYEKMEAASDGKMKRNQVEKNERVGTKQSERSKEWIEIEQGIHPSFSAASVRHK